MGGSKGGLPVDLWWLGLYVSNKLMHKSNEFTDTNVVYNLNETINKINNCSGNPT